MAYATKYDQLSSERENDRIAERKIQRKSLLDTFLVLLVLTGLIFLLKIPPVYPPMPESDGGMQIVLGNDAVGMNDTKEPVMAGAPQNTPQPVSTPVQPEAAAPTPAPTQTTDPDAVDVKTQKPTKTTTTAQPVTPAKTSTTKPHPATTTPARQANPNDLFKASAKTGNNGPGGNNPNKGNGNKSGNQGSPDGIPDGGWQKYGSGKAGTGSGFRLAGRGSKTFPEANCGHASFQKEIDIVQIVVDEQGNVIEAHGGYRGSTITDADAIACDEIAAKKAKFTASPDGTTRQTGQIRFIRKPQ